MKEGLSRPNDRLELVKGPRACKKQKAKLVIAKLDRLSRNLAFMMDSGVEFVAVDNPHANKLTIHILAAVAQHEAGNHQRTDIGCPESSQGAGQTPR